mgnify:CR=1 FL=1
MGGMIKLAIERPVAVMAMILMTVIFGVVAVQSIPIQMSPDIEKPVLDVRVRWNGASPSDVDREIVGRLESELSALNGVEKIASRSTSVGDAPAQRTRTSRTGFSISGLI